MAAATYKSRFVTDGNRLYEVDMHIRGGVILIDARNGQLVSVTTKDFFQMEIVKSVA